METAKLEKLRGERLSKYEVHLNAFMWRDALDSAIHTGSENVIASMLTELSRRGESGSRDDVI